MRVIFVPKDHKFYYIYLILLLYAFIFHWHYHHCFYYPVRIQSHPICQHTSYKSSIHDKVGTLLTLMVPVCTLKSISQQKWGQYNYGTRERSGKIETYCDVWLIRRKYARKFDASVMICYKQLWNKIGMIVRQCFFGVIFRLKRLWIDK